jgi:hypothetical protein
MKTGVVISGAKRERDAKENIVVQRQLEYILRRHGFTNISPVYGSDNATVEEGFWVDLGEEHPTAAISDLCAIAGMFQQEYLLIDRDGRGTLKMVGKGHLQEHCLGVRHPFPRPPATGDWTLINGEYVQYR